MDDEDFDFEELYDSETLAALDSWEPPQDQPDGPAVMPSRLTRWSRNAAMGAVLTGFALGLQEIFDPTDKEQIVVEVDADGNADHLPIQLFLDPDSPAGSLCVIRRTARPPML